jgi:hypothetical protein
MPRLSEYLNERDLLPRGRYSFLVTDVSFTEDDKKEYPTIQIKGKINNETYVIFRYLHPRMLWAVASDLIHTGADSEAVDTSNNESILAAYKGLVGQTLDVNVKIKQSEGYADKNDFTVRGIADGAASV